MLIERIQEPIKLPAKERMQRLLRGIKKTELVDAVDSDHESQSYKNPQKEQSEGALAENEKPESGLDTLSAENDKTPSGLNIIA